MSSKKIILLVFLLIVTSIRGQIPWRIDKLGIEEGLSEGSVYAIHQDKKGFIWIGTHGGLNRYDGYGFRVFQYMPFDSSSLGDNSVFFLKEDPATGRFWIGGSSCLNEFDPETFSNTRYRYTNSQLEFSDGVFVSKDEILLACEYDVLLFNTQTKTFFQIPVYDESGQPAQIARVENAAADRKGNFMILCKTGVFFYDPLTKTCKRKTDTSPDFSPFYQYEVFNVLQDKRGYYWIATNKDGLIRFEPATQKIFTLSLPGHLKNRSLRFDVVAEDKDGNIWAGSSNGLFKIEPLTMDAQYFSTNVNKAVSLSHPEINAILEDRNHFLWIGTVGGGINKMIPQNTGFKNLLIAKDSSGNKTGTYIMGLQQSGLNIWFINIWDQVGKIYMQTGQVTMLEKPVLPPGYSWYSEGSIQKNKSNDIVVLNGENAYEIAQNTAGNISVNTKPAPGIFYIHHARNGHTYYMAKATVPNTFCRNDTIYGNQFFYDAKDDTAGNTWIGTSKGLVKLNTITNEIIQYQHEDFNINSISSDYIYALEIDNTNQNIWMAAYHGGLCSYNMHSSKFRHYSKEDGLADNIVYSLEKDKYGNLWFSTNAGISSYNISKNIFRNYGKSDGLLNNEFDRRASFKNPEGWIFFGGVFGIDYFHPDSIRKDNTVPNLAFTNFRVFDHDYIAGNRSVIPLIELNYSDRYIAVEFAALSYNDLQNIQYAYRLDSDKDWIKLGHQHVLSFSDLKAGQHRLYIRSTDGAGAWLDNSISCTILVHPPWWQTWWFRLMAGILIIGVLIIGTRFYFQQKLEKQKSILEKKQAVEKERTRIATDMHDDLGAGLSRIKFLSETIGIKKQLQQPIDEDIVKIKEYSHEMIDKMGEIVWALNEKNDTVSDLLAYARSYSVEYLSQNGIACTISAPEFFPSDFVTGEFRRNIFLTLKEALHNVVKHSRASAVSIKLSVNNGLAIEIHDNGIGFDKTNIRIFSNGITNMKKRMAEIKGEFRISNEQGTLIKIKAPLNP